MNACLNRARGIKNLSVFRTLLAIGVTYILSSANCALAQRLGSDSGSSSLHESERAAQVRALNNSVLQLHGQMQENASGGEVVRGQAAIVLAQRAAALQALIQDNPHSALSFAFSPELLADLAVKFPQSSSLLEAHVTVSGQLEHWTEDRADKKTSRSYFFLEVGQRTLSLHFAGPEPIIKSGEELEVTGVVLGSKMAVSTARVLARSSALVPAEQVSWENMVSLAHRLRSQVAISLATLILFVLFGFAVKVPRVSGRRVFNRLLVFAACLGLVLAGPRISYAQNVCSTTGVQNIAVLLVQFPGLSLSVSPQSIQSIFFSSTGPSLANYWSDASYGLTTVSGDVFGPYTLAGYDCTQLNLLRDAAITAAADAGVPIQNYTRIYLIAPNICNDVGFALGSCLSLNSPNGSFIASTSILNQAYTTPQTTGVELAAHLGGHNMGLGHAHLLQFTDSTGAGIPLGALSDPGSMTEYGDHFSVMSDDNLGHYAAPQKAMLGWLSDPANYQTVTTSATYTVEPLETSPPGLKALRVQRGSQNPGYYLWMEYRQPVGQYDSTLTPTQVFQGADIHYEFPVTATSYGSGAASWLLDYTAPAAYWDTPALVVGNTWADPYSDLSITVVSATPTGLTVNVSYSGIAPCTVSAPSVSVSPLDPSTYPGQTASYSVSITNNDSASCSSSTINLGSTEPSGWSTYLSSSLVTLSPGQSASVTMGKGAPSGTPVGTYAVNLTASNTSFTGTGTANATVMASPSLAVTVAVSGSNFVPPGTVAIAASVTNGGTPASGASVTFTLTTPNGSTTTQTATAGTNGTATWNYKLNAKSLAGTYFVSARATLGSGSKKAASTQSVTSNTASFLVQ